MENSEEFLKNIAAQLSCPQGKLGFEVAERMHLNNIGMTRSAMEALPLKENDKILEIGHGSGMHIPELFSKQKNLTYHGLERSELMWETAKNANADLVNQQKAVFSFSDTNTFPFKTDFFDAIFTVNTLYFWEKPVDFLNETQRILKPGGSMVICFSPKEFMKTLPFTSYGFNLYEVDDVRKIVDHSRLQWKGYEEFSEVVETNGNIPFVRRYVVAVCEKTIL